MKKRISQIQSRIQETALSCNRKPEDIRLIAVSKTKPSETINQAITCGLTIFGENYIQESKAKITEINSSSISWHFIGHLQSNKAKFAVKLFDLIHTVDSMKLASELDRQARKIDKIQQVLLQVNVGQESSKSGVTPSMALQLAKEVSQLQNIKVLGLMTIPPYYNAPERVFPFFRRLRELRDEIRNKNFPNVEMKELSMGMTGDFEVAIQEGATLIRIGTAIFGERG